MEEWIEAKRRSKIPRINWRKILWGKTLTEFIIERKAYGKKKEEIILELSEILQKKKELLKKMGFSLSKALDNMRISVGARWAESDTEHQILVKKGWYVFKAKVRTFKDGSKWIYFPPHDYKEGDIVIVKVKKGVGK